MKVTAIDLTPTWGEIGNITWRLASSNEQTALEKLRPEFARAFASAQALLTIAGTLTEDQRSLVAKTMAEELAKQGY